MIIKFDLFLIIILLLLFLAIPNTASASSILLYEDFSSSLSPSWTSINPWGSWSVSNGLYIGTSTLQQSPALPSYSYIGDSDWTNYRLETKIKSIQGIDKQVLFRINTIEDRAYILNLRSAYFNGGNDVILAKRNPLGSEQGELLTVVNFPNYENTWYSIKVDVLNDGGRTNIKIYIDNEKIIDYLDENSPILQGQVGFEVVPGGYQQSPIGLTTETAYDFIKVSDIPTFPEYKQHDPQWANKIYDTASIWSPNNSGIDRWGCALTSAAMILSYYGHTITPDNLNLWLNENDGYIENGRVDWSAITKYALLSHEINSLLPKLEYKRYNYTEQLLKSELSESKPSIVKLLRNEDNGTHFVVVNDMDGDMLLMSDPASDEQFLSYYDTYTPSKVGTFTQSNTDLSYLYLYLSDNFTLKVVSPSGEDLSNEVETQTPFIDQFSLELSKQDSFSEFQYPKPIKGRYIVTVKGNGKYQLKSRVYDSIANLNKFEFAGNLNNTSHIYIISVSEDNTQISKIDFDYLKKNIEEAYVSKKIKNSNEYKLLLGFVNSAEKQFNKGNRYPAKIILDALLKNIKSSGKLIEKNYAVDLIETIKLIEATL